MTEKESPNFFTISNSHSWLLQGCVDPTLKNYCPAGIYLLKVNNRNTRRRCEICSKLTIKIPSRHWLLNLEHAKAQTGQVFNCALWKFQLCFIYICKVKFPFLKKRSHWNETFSRILSKRLRIFLNKRLLISLYKNIIIFIEPQCS